MNKIISKEEFIHFMMEMEKKHSRHSFVSIITETVPRLKKGFIFDPNNIKKISVYNAMIGLDYSSVIKNRLMREGKSAECYQPGDSWHKAVPGSKIFRQHKTTGELYFYVFCVANNPVIVNYYNTITGDKIKESDIKPYLYASCRPKNQGLCNGNEIIVRTLKIDSVVKVVIDHINYYVQ